MMFVGGTLAMHFHIHRLFILFLSEDSLIVEAVQNLDPPLEAVFELSVFLLKKKG